MRRLLDGPADEVEGPGKVAGAGALVQRLAEEEQVVGAIRLHRQRLLVEVDAFIHTALGHPTSAQWQGNT